MSEIKNPKVEIRAKNEGMIRSFVSLGSQLCETTVVSALGSVEDIRSGSLRIVRGLIEWLDETQQASIEIARKLTDRVDTVTRAFVQAGEEALKSVVHTTEETTQTVVDGASRSAAAFISKSGNHVPQPRAESAAFDTV